MICFKKNKKCWFIFAWISVGILLGFFLVIKQEIRLVGRVRKLMEYCHQVFDMLNSLLMVVLFLHINIVWIATVGRSIKRQCGFIILSSSNFSIQCTKRFKRSIFPLFVCHFNHNEDQEHMNLFEDMLRFEYLWLGQRI